MKISTLGLFLSFVVLCSACSPRINPGFTPSASPSDAPMYVVSPIPLPKDWQQFHDDVIGYKIGYPKGFIPSKAVSSNSESSILFRAPRVETKNLQIHDDDFKVSVTRFSNDSSHIPDQLSKDEIIESIPYMMLGQETSLVRTKGQIESFSLRLRDDGDTVVITGFPANSQKAEFFTTMLSSFSFIPRVSVDTPVPYSTITSPLTIEGSAPGSWFFEGVLKARLQTFSGALLGTAKLSAQQDWMTEDEVPFSGSLSFQVPKGAMQGQLIIENDNPSGIPEYNKSFVVPLAF